MSTEKEPESYRYEDLNSEVSGRLEVIGQLASGIAHEINTPVQYIGDNIRYVASEIDNLIEVIEKYRNLEKFLLTHEQALSQLAELKSFSEQKDLEFLVQDIPEALGHTIQGVETIAAIVRSLKSLVHPGGKQKVLTNVNECIEHAVTLGRSEWKQHGSLRTDLQKELPSVLCYPGELSQVVLNLIVNAAHAIGESSGHGEILVQSFRYKESIGVQISDTGPGIPMQIQHRIFDPFFTSKDVGKGTGQGLAFAYKSIVERNEGTLFFETQEGEGTTFHIYLPLDS